MKLSIQFRYQILMLAGLLMASGIASAIADESKRLPNIVFLIADDLGVTADSGIREVEALQPLGRHLTKRLGSISALRLS